MDTLTIIVIFVIACCALYEICDWYQDNKYK